MKPSEAKRSKKTIPKRIFSDKSINFANETVQPEFDEKINKNFLFLRVLCIEKKGRTQFVEFVNNL